MRARATALFLTALAVPAPAQTGATSPSPDSGVRVATAPVAARPPVIDGRLDDDAWRNAPLLSGFIQRELREGDPVSERTEVRILTDGEALYIAAWLYDGEPQGIVFGEKVRDTRLTNSDYFAIILDTYLDRQNGFVFATTPAGIEYDGQVVREGEGGGVFQPGQTRATAGSMGGFNLNWDGSWTVATSVDSLGWYAEFRIPFSTLRYGPGTEQTWGLNLARRIARKNEEAYWSFIPRQFNLYRLSRAGTLEIARVPARRIAVATPYVLGGARRDFASMQSAQRTADIGVDAKLGLTPGLTLDLTVNTDFAQVEVDEQRTNLTRFPLFFPEKRPFFLENAGVFSAGTPQAVELFFSRRIGIDPLGQPVPILGGGRLTGRVGGLTVGALQIVTDEVAGVQPTTSYSVARVTRELSARSRVGVIAVERAPLQSGFERNSTYGLDGRLGLGDAWTVDAWAAKTSTPSLSSDDLGYSVRGSYQTADWNLSSRVVQVGADFNPQVGFLNRAGGYEFYEAMAMRLVRHAPWAWFKQWNPHASIRRYYRPDGAWQSGQIHIDLTEVELASGARFGPELNIYHEGLQQPFEIASGVVLPVAEYDWASVGLDWSSNPSAPLSFSARGDFGPFYNGTRNGGSTTVTLRQGASVSTSLLADYQAVRLEQGNFERQLFGARVAYFFTPRVFVQSLMQYSSQAEIWSANVRFGWLSTAGTGLFVVLNDAEEADGPLSWQRPQTRSVIVKYTRQMGRGQ